MKREDFFKKKFSELAKKYNSPLKVQKYIRRFAYNSELSGETLCSAAEVLKRKTAHCYEATFLAAAILENIGYPPLVLSIESQDQLDHVIYVYQHKNKWGSIARSRDEGLHGRKPVYRSLRDLVYSYYEPYIDKTGCIVGFQIANLDQTKSNWRYGKRNLWKAEKYLIDLKHQKIPYNKKRYKKTHQKYLSGELSKKQKSWL